MFELNDARDGRPRKAVESDVDPNPRPTKESRGIGCGSKSTAYQGKPWNRMWIRIHGRPRKAVESDVDPDPLIFVFLHLFTLSYDIETHIFYSFSQTQIRINFALICS